MKLVEDLALTDVVTFEGQVESPLHAYHAASLVVLSSISEGFPYTVVEAMACARTVVCTDVGGVKEAVGDAGFVVPPRNPEPMAAAILRLLDDEPLRLRLAARARQRVLKNFTLEHSLAAYQRVYDDLLRPVSEGAVSPTLGGVDLLSWEMPEAGSDAEMQESTS
jgi:glycosyltransferase involved in cell wall biosynthesis